jgi:prepilin-type N-terminal cleavage/methylation domain-containing protein
MNKNAARSGVRTYAHKSLRGFTLIEMLFVVALISIVGAMSIPSIYNMARNYRIRNDARTIVGQLTLARMRAAASFSRVKVQCYSTNSGNYCDIESRKDAPSEFSPDSRVREYLSAGDIWDFPTGANGAGSGQSGATALPCGAVVFNSRGLPVYDSKVKNLDTKYADCQSTPSGAKDGDTKDNYVFYLKNNSSSSYAAVVIDSSGRANVWRWTKTGSTGAWEQIKD